MLTERNFKLYARGQNLFATANIMGRIVAVSQRAQYEGRRPSKTTFVRPYASHRPTHYLRVNQPVSTLNGPLAAWSNFIPRTFKRLFRIGSYRLAFIRGAMQRSCKSTNFQSNDGTFFRVLHRQVV